MILLNGELQDLEKIHLDSGFYFGRGLFETMLVKREPVFLREHLDRINNGLQIINVDKKIAEEDVLDAVSKLKCEDCVLKLVVTDKNVIYTTRKNNYTEEHYKKGFKVKISSTKRNQYATTTYLKSLNYLENILEHENCIKEGYNEVIFFNTNGNLTEGSVSNVFFIKDRKIYTPFINCGLLNGTVRKFMMNNYNVVEGEFNNEDLINSDEIFLTNSIMGVMKVSRIGEKSITISDMTENIRKRYEEYISQ